MSLKRTIRPYVRGTAGMLQDSLEKLKSIPENTVREVLGTSVEGREIYRYTVGTGNRTALFVSAIHGNEVGTVKLAHHLLAEICQDEELTKGLTCHVVPCLNPDGYHRALKHPDYLHGGRVGRFNANEVDLNRNFDTPSFQRDAFWNHGLNYQESTKVFAGEAAGSEPETRALTEFIEANDVDVLFMFHNAGQDVMGSSHALAKQLSQIFARCTGYSLVSDHMWKSLAQTGTPREWCEQRKIPLVEIEGPNRWSSGWSTQKGALLTTLKHLQWL